MKKMTVTKLQLTKETVRSLQREELRQLAGGFTGSVIVCCSVNVACTH
jgi:natural product precursor